MNESDWNNDFEENFDEVLQAARASSNSNRFFSRSPVKETLHDDLETRFKNKLDLNEGRKFISLQDFNRMDFDEHRTLSKDDYVDGFDDPDQMTIKPGQFSRQPSKTKSLRFLELFTEQQDDFELEEELPIEQQSPSKASRFYTTQGRSGPDKIRFLSSPSRSTSSSVSLSDFSETEYTEDEDFFEGFVLNNNISLLKRYQLRKERALKQAQLEYDNLMKYNSLLNSRKIQSSGNIAKLQKIADREDDFINGFDPMSLSNFQRPKRPLPRNKVKHSQSSYTLGTKSSVPSLGLHDNHRKLKHSASNYFDFRPSKYSDIVNNLESNESVTKFGECVEMDNIEEVDIQDRTLTKQDKKSIRKLIDLANYMEVYNDNHRSRHGKSSKASQKGLGLIKQLSSADKERVIHNTAGGEMKYNPQTYRWEGNELDLNKFEPKSQPKTLHTITKKRKGNTAQTVGNMVFDPQSGYWCDANANEEDDPFKDLQDLPCEPESRLASSKRGASNSTVRTASTLATQRVLDNIDEEDTFTSQDPFDIAPALITKFRHEELKWHKKVRNWFPPGEQDSRDHLYEIKRMVSDSI